MAWDTHYILESVYNTCADVFQSLWRKRRADSAVTKNNCHAEPRTVADTESIISPEARAAVSSWSDLFTFVGRWFLFLFLQHKSHAAHFNVLKFDLFSMTSANNFR